MKAARGIIVILFVVSALAVIEQVAQANHCDDIAQQTQPANNSTGVSLTPKLMFNVPQINEDGCVIEKIRIQIATSGNFQNIVFDVSNLGNAQTPPLLYRTVPEGKLQPQTKYYWRLRVTGYYDPGPPIIAVDIDSDWSNYRTFTTGIAPIIVQPQCNWPMVANKSPQDNSTVNILTPTLELTIGNVLAPACLHEMTEWEVATSPDFELGTVVIGSRNRLLVQWQLMEGRLQDLTTYYWRARLHGPAGDSPWTEPTSFTIRTSVLIVQPPCNWPSIVHDSPPNQSLNISLTPRLIVSHGPGLIAAPACPHDLSQWQIATDANFNDIVADTGAKPSNLLSFTLPDHLPLSGNTLYYWRVRFLSNGGATSRWSAATSFTTGGGNNGAEPPDQPEPPSNNANELCDFDTNRNGVLDDPEFFGAVDSWIAEAIENGLFFSAVDAWIGQSQVCVAALSEQISPVIQPTLQKSRSALVITQSSKANFMSVEVFSLEGDRIFAGQCACNQLRWNLHDQLGERVANGVYLYRITLYDADGNSIRSEVRKLVLLG